MFEQLSRGRHARADESGGNFREENGSAIFSRLWNVETSPSQLILACILASYYSHRSLHPELATGTNSQRGKSNAFTGCLAPDPRQLPRNAS